MQDKKRVSQKNKYSIKNITKGSGFSAFSSALLAIALGLIFGFVI
jgi:hypothetical protein